MKIKRMFVTAFLAAAVTLTGCAEKAETIPEDDSENGAGYTLSELRDSYEAGGGVFSFSVDEESGLMEYNSNDMGNYELAFKNDEDMAMISVMSIVNFHQTIESVCKGREKDYAKIYTHVLGSQSAVNGNPSYTTTGDFKNNDIDFKFGSIGVQYGNGDLFFIIYTVPKDMEEKYENYANSILNTLEYTGEPLKTEPETYETDYFSVTAGPDWYFYNKGDDQTTIIYNLAASDEAAMCTLKISSLAIADTAAASEQVQELAEKCDGDDTISDLIQAHGKVGDFDAEYIGYNMNVGDSDKKEIIYYDAYFFDKDDRCYAITMIAPEAAATKFMSGAQQIIGTLNVK